MVAIWNTLVECVSAPSILYAKVALNTDVQFSEGYVS